MAAAEFAPFCARIQAPNSVAESWWTRLSTLYAGPNRFYHTVTHMDALTELWREYRSSLRRPDAVLAAIYFHDAIYEPRMSDNEEKSADLFREFLSQVKVATGLDDVYDWILATKEHQKAVVTDPDLNFFLDMDLAILGASRPVYEEYARNIRREYIHVPEQLYRTKRPEFLQRFHASIDTLFRTSQMKERFVATARENLAWEIAFLQSDSPLL